MAGYCFYALFALLNELLGGGREMIGAVFFLVVIAALSVRRFFPLPLTRWTLALLMAALLPIAAALGGCYAAAVQGMDYAIKYFALLSVLLAAATLRLTPLYRAPDRWWGACSILAVLLFGLWRGAPEDRVAGYFANPNNYALAAISLLFFIDPTRDSRKVIVGAYALVAGLIILSGTTGALAGFLAGVAVGMLYSRYAKPACVALGVGLVLGALLLAAAQFHEPADRGDMRVIGPLLTKVSVVRQNYADVVAGDDVNFWDVGLQYGGPEVTSGLWRISHWRETLLAIRDSPASVWLFGQGIGSSRNLLGQLPHNDYLRLLFEVGVLGLLANLFVWLLPFTRIDPVARGPAVMMGVYAFTENNFDNFLVMSLFALFLVSASRPSPLDLRSSGTPP